MFTFIIAIFSCLGSTGSLGISTYLCLAGFLDTTSNGWHSVRGVRFQGVTENLFFSSFEISSPPKTLPHINLTIILQSFGDNWILLPPSAVLAWEGGGSPFSFSELSGESVDPKLPISPLSCNFKISNANQKPLTFNVEKIIIIQREENRALTSLGCYVPVTYTHIFSVLYIISLYISWDENLESYDLHFCQFYIFKTCIVRDSFFILNQVSAFILEHFIFLHLIQRKREVSFKPQPLDFMKLFFLAKVQYVGKMDGHGINK